ncbi:MAG: ribosome-binding factor A, partial [Buchnera aphidicola]|nr:ribosome-binding factor A [Buchnera aphidicola]MDE5286038.1 ribosome-binding factor A [Buchnera aphidicola]
MKKSFNRSVRIEQELQKKIAFIIQNSLNDPRINILITVSKVIL